MYMSSMVSVLWLAECMLWLAIIVAKTRAQDYAFNGKSMNAAVAATTATSLALSNAPDSPTSCGGILKEPRGNIHTPHFPRKFAVPLHCVWIIDASSYHTQNISINIYFTQQFVLSGLSFTQYLYYDNDIRVKNDQKQFEVNEQNVTDVSYVRFFSPFLEIKFDMSTVFGTHLRALDHLLDVYGFNITYEVDEIVKEHQCNALKCRYLGHCYATKDYS